MHVYLFGISVLSFLFCFMLWDHFCADLCAVLSNKNSLCIYFVIEICVCQQYSVHCLVVIQNLFRPLPFHPVPSCPIPSHHVLSRPIMFCPVPSCSVAFHPVPSCHSKIVPTSVCPVPRIGTGLSNMVHPQLQRGCLMLRESFKKMVSAISAPSHPKLSLFQNLFHIVCLIIIFIIIQNRFCSHSDSL